MNDTEKQTYFSTWIYASLFVLSSIPEFRTSPAMAKRLTLPQSIVEQHLRFLLEQGIVVKKGDQYSPGTTRIHLSPRSPLIAKHHTNWRLRALHSLESQNQSDMHFSTVYSISEKGLEQVREKLRKVIEEVEPIVAGSTEEKAICLSMDLFEI